MSRNFLRFFGVVLAAAAVLTLASCQKAANDVTDPAQLRGGETRETLSPDQFTGDVRAAYQIAKEIPQVLDSLYCYCDCKKHFGHKSLLTCYVDEHAKNCDLCMDEAFVAYQLHRQGKDVITIRKTIDEKFSRMRH